MTHPLMQAILADPDDDTPRLVYADWLQENGDPDRAEFIRLQCALAERGREGPLPDPRTDPMAARAAELEATHGQRWLKAMPVVRGLMWASFERGFPGVYASNGAALERGAERLWSLAPVELVNLVPGYQEQTTAISKSPYIDRVRVLVLNTRFPAHAIELLSVERLARLRRLTLTRDSYSGSPIPVVEAIAQMPHLNQLVTLSFTGVLTDAAALALARSPHLPALRYISAPARLSPPAAPADDAPNWRQRLYTGRDPELSAGALAELLHRYPLSNLRDMTA